jgi:hypothetical protein
MKHEGKAKVSFVDKGALKERRLRSGLAVSVRLDRRGPALQEKGAGVRMSRTIRLLAVAAMALGLIAATTASAAPAEKVTLCHKPGTEDEATISVGAPAVPAHLAHGDTEGPCQPPLTDEIIDADGIVSAGSGDPGAREVQPGNALTSFPVTGTADAGLDMFDQDSNGLWTQGVDDLHSEDPGTCATAIRDGVHQLGQDCKVLDVNGDLANGEPVDCDIEVGFSFSGMTCPPVDVKYHDANADAAWDSGEDLVLDVNNNGVFD